MADSLLLNNKVYHMVEGDLPCLIHYVPKTGGSHFSVTLMADMFLRGTKILFFTAYSTAKDNFLQQISGMESNTAFITDEGQLSTDHQGIILESGNEGLFMKVVEKLADLNERVVLIKNMEVFQDYVFDACLGLNKIIISGDLDRCSAKKIISEKQFKTMIFFSKPKIQLKVNMPILGKYTGYLLGDSEEGLILTRAENLPILSEAE